VKKSGLALAFILPAAVLGFADFGGDPAIVRMTAIALMISVLWMTEAVPLAATALMPLVLFPLLGISSTEAVAVQYTNSVVFLLIGGFMIALAMERWNLHKRIALNVIAVFGNQPFRLMIGFIVATAGLSMWISNTATTLVMLPIATAILTRFESSFSKEQTRNFSIGLMLAIAYSSSIGGMMTPIGTAPNLVFLRLYEKVNDGGSIGFAEWMMLVVPIGVAMLVLMSMYLGYVFFRDLPAEDTIHRSVMDEKRQLGRMSFEEKVVAFVFGLTAALWISRQGIAVGQFYIPGWQGMLSNGDLLDDTTVAVLMSCVLFLVPARLDDGTRTRILDSEVFHKLPWSVVILFGGGFALAFGFVDSGLSAYIASQLGDLGNTDTTLVIALISTGMTFLTELTSNTATTQLLLPILQSGSEAMQLNPIWLMLPATLSASCAFMLPVATPPNAIIFGTGKLQVIDMVKCGFILNLIGIAVIVIAVVNLVPLVLTWA
jgi:solute carrier family 13 (sodium-dependent dicarboxylate transporter), member 2/3/5